MYFNSRKVKKEIKWKGIVVAGILSLITLLTFFSGLHKITNFILGIFGLMFYPMMILGILISIAYSLNMRFSMSNKNLAYIIGVTISLAMLLHTAFLIDFAKTDGIKFSNYFSLLKSVVTYQSGVTVGGVILSIFTYPIMCLLSGVGACIMFGIVLVIFVAITADYYLNIKSMDRRKIKATANTRYVDDEKTAKTDTIGGLLEDSSKVNTGADNGQEDDMESEPFNFDGGYTSGDKNGYNDITENSSPQNAVPITDPYTYKKPSTPYVYTKDENGVYVYSPKEDVEQGYETNGDDVDNTEDEGYIIGDDYSENDDEYPTDDDPIIDDSDGTTPDWITKIIGQPTEEIDDTSKTGTIDGLGRGRGRDRFGGGVGDPFTPFSSTGMENGTDDQETLGNPIDKFFGSKPKAGPEQIPIGINIGKPTKYKPQTDKAYCPPPTSILEYRSDDESTYGGDFEQKSTALEQVLSSFNVDAKVIGVVRGPNVTQYELSMPYGTSVRKILSYDSDISAALRSKGGVRIEAPIPGKNAVGVEVANDKRSTVGLREMLESKEFQTSSVNLPVALGKSITGEVVVKSLPKLVHMLIAGSTGSGKSVFLHSLILSLMYKCSPSQLRFIMIDPKRVEFSCYNGMPHMMIPNAVCDCDKAINALGWAVKEMDRRFKKLQQYGFQNIQDFNHSKCVTETHEEQMIPYLVIVIDELADLMMVGKKDVEEKIARLAQLGRASGIHMMIATQRPSADIITGTIKNNLPTRVALSLGSSVDSRVILDETGAEKLLGYGDMLVSAQDSNVTVRLQGGYMSMDEVKKVVEYIKDHNEINFDDDLEREILTDPKQEGKSAIDTTGGYDPENPDQDELLPSALKLCIQSGGASINMVQRRFRVGYSRAARIIDQMELAGYISPGKGSKLRTVHMSMEEFNEKFGDNVN